MSLEEDCGIELACVEAIRLLECVSWRFTQSARHAGYALDYTECKMTELLIKWLKMGLRPQKIELGDPPGSGGIGYFYRNPEGQNLYVKFKLEWDELVVLSFKAQH